MSMIKKIAWQNSRKKSSPNIILFDMDGTLTPPREQFDLSLLEGLRSLSTVAEIGILSGSNYSYIQEQMSHILTKSELKFKTHILPCNGTQYYPPLREANARHEKLFSVFMKDELGDQNYRELIKIILELQEHISKKSIPLSGNFIDYRESMVNWCPIGRSASSSERKEFIEIDNQSGLHSMRTEYLDRLRLKLKRLGWNDKITCALGGDTSFDIYPSGWDKTFALRHFENKEIWFVGDRCDEGGNDKALYDLLKPSGRSYCTEGPAHTKHIIKQIIMDII